MKSRFLIAIGALACAAAAVAGPESAPAYTPDGRVKLPADYREWIFLSSGLDMSYNPAAKDPSMHMFNNVFVAPAAYRAFLESGTWPEKTVMVLEVRGASGQGSINKRGQFQTPEIMGMELHVKDAARFTGGWAFFSPDGPGTAKQIPYSEDCYSCHRDHAAVDTTFVQFYPTLLPLAENKHTLSAGYLKETNSGQLVK